MKILLFLVSAVLWLLESICVNFGLEDYMEAGFALIFLIAGNYYCWVVVRFIAHSLAEWLLKHILVLQWVDAVAVKIVQSLKGFALDLEEKIVSSLYEQVMWEINHSRKKVLRQRKTAEMRAARIRREMRR